MTMAFIDTLKSKFDNNKKVAENYFFMTFLASSALVIGLIIYAMILFVVVQLKDQRILNQFRPEQIKVIQDYIQMYIAH